MIELRFRHVKQDDLQLLRYWRNFDHVRLSMATPKLITVEDQRRWFESLDLETNVHFIYGLGETDIGSVNLSGVKKSEGTFEAGLYCGNNEYLTHWVNICACLFIYDFAFDRLCLKVASAIILDNNRSALSLNTSIGYRRMRQHAPGIGAFVLNRDDYLARSKVLKRYLPIWLISFVPLIGPLVCLGNVLCIFRDSHACAHDDVAGSKVVPV